MPITTHYKVPVLMFWLWSLATFLFVLTVFYGVYQQQQLQASYQKEVAIAQTELRDLAHNSVRNAGTNANTTLIKDCTSGERSQFERQLGKLRSLNDTEAAELTKLFDRCGDFFARQKQLHTERLLASIDKLVALHSAFAVDSELSHGLTMWQRIGKLEQERTSLYTELVGLQRELITSQRMAEPERANTQEELLELVGRVQTKLDTHSQELNQLLTQLE